MFRTQKCEFLFGIDIGDSCSDDAETCDLVVPYNVANNRIAADREAGCCNSG